MDGLNLAAFRRCQTAPMSAVLDEFIVRRPTADDHPRVLAVLDDWWGHRGGSEGSRQRAALLPRLFFEHFTSTSLLVERPDGRLVAFLVAFLSPSEPAAAYVHFVGVDPSMQRAGVGRALYQRFLDDAARQGARTVRCIPAASISRPETPKTSDATVESLIWASSSSFSTRFFSAVRTATRSAR